MSRGERFETVFTAEDVRDAVLYWPHLRDVIQRAVAAQGFQVYARDEYWGIPVVAQLRVSGEVVVWKSNNPLTTQFPTTALTFPG